MLFLLGLMALMPHHDVLIGLMMMVLLLHFHMVERMPNYDTAVHCHHA
jgi:hypothetical protein